MATRKTRVPNADVVPPIHTNLFAASPTSKFALVALGGGFRPNPIYTAYLDLRTNVYTRQTGMLNIADLTYDVDIDDDDDRSTSFLVAMNREPEPVAVGCVRVIERLGNDNRPLPADELYGLDLPAGGVEVSRYICRLDNAEEQAHGLKELLRSTIAHILQVGAEDDVYAIVERPLERVLRIMGVGITRVAEPIWLDEYQGVNVAVKLDPIASAANLGGLAEIEALDVSEGAIRFWGDVTQ